MELIITDREGKTVRIEAEAGENLMEVLTRHDLDVEAICGGTASCGTCHVYVDAESDAKIPPNDFFSEELLASLEHRRAHSRLSCQLVLEECLHKMRITIAPAEM